MPARDRDQCRAATHGELGIGRDALAREADTPRLRCADPADLGTRESVWPIRSRHEYAIGVAVIEMAPDDTTVGSTPYTEINFAAFAMLGLRFCPRIRGVQHQRIYRIDPNRDYYGSLAS